MGSYQEGSSSACDAGEPIKRPIYVAVDIRRRSLAEIVELIDEPNRTPVKKLFRDHWGSFRQARGAKYNHQAWEGGWIDHTVEVGNIGIVNYQLHHAIRPLPFSLSDVCLVNVLHDIEKPWKYEKRDGERYEFIRSLDTREKVKEFVGRLLDQYGFRLTPEHRNALEFVEGEIGRYSSTERMMGPLASFCHACDNPSARMWPDHPLERDDPWLGAVRSASGKDDVGWR